MCSLEPTPAPTVCSQRVVEVEQEVCTEVEMLQFREVCTEEPRLEQQVDCSVEMKEVELKEICLDIDLQLPREECVTHEKQECRFEVGCTISLNCTNVLTCSHERCGCRDASRQ